MEVLEIKKKLENIQDMPETEEKQTLLEAMSMTQTWLNLEDLKQILPKEKYVDIETKLKEVLKKQITEKEGWTKEKIENLRRKRMEKEFFFLARDDNGKFSLRRQNYADIVQKRDFVGIDLEEILSENLKKVVVNAMKKHREFNVFYANEQLTDEEIIEVLDNAIANISATKQRGITLEDIESVSSGVRIEEFRNASGNLSKDMKEVDNERDGTALGDE